ncbi:hypothetical protein CW362_02115 [Streptomyces populi]|uniref:Uncharacterized protein n=2 Tax=Streptomyces populi TaxID=2058924 RepID=A0A2I0SXX6_9ACTN|nr:hypothetical protein CW362_02115 [Streptomyces populi]
MVASFMSAEAAAVEPRRGATLQRLQELRKGMQRLSVDDEASTEPVLFTEMPPPGSCARLRRGARVTGSPWTDARQDT